MIKLLIDYSFWGEPRNLGNHLWEATLEIVQPDLCVLHEVQVDATGKPLHADRPPDRRFLQHVRHEEVADGFRIHADAVSADRKLLGPITIHVGNEHITLTTGSAVMPTISRRWYSADGVTPNDVALQQMKVAVRAWKVDVPVA